jgi:hypothetical protein
MEFEGACKSSLFSFSLFLLLLCLPCSPNFYFAFSFPVSSISDFSYIKKANNVCEVMAAASIGT